MAKKNRKSFGSHCRHCYKSLEVSRDDKYQFYNKPLAVTDYFYVLPALGPVLAGHVIVFLKKHLPSFAYLDMDALNDYGSIFKRIIQMPPYDTAGVLEYENAGTYEEPGAACVWHAHMNVMPYNKNIIKHVSKLHVNYPGDRNLFYYLPKREPYVYISYDGLGYMCDVSMGDTQFMRKVMLEAVGCTDWDWREHTNLDVVRQTISFWEAFNED